VGNVLRDRSKGNSQDALDRYIAAFIFREDITLPDAQRRIRVALEELGRDSRESATSRVRKRLRCSKATVVKYTKCARLLAGELPMALFHAAELEVRAHQKRRKENQNPWPWERLKLWSECLDLLGWIPPAGDVEGVTKKQDAASRLGVSTRTISRWCASGKLEAAGFDDAGRALVTKASVLRMMVNRRPLFRYLLKGLSGLPPQKQVY